MNKRVISLVLTLFMLVGIWPVNLSEASDGSDKYVMRWINDVKYTEPFSIYYSKDKLELDIKGVNFKEDIKGIRFINKLTGKVVDLPNKYKKDDEDVTLKNIEFISSNHIKATLQSDALNDFLKPGNGGSYKIYIDFENGQHATSIDDEDSFNELVVYEKPYVTDTNPNKNDWNVDKNSLETTFSNNQSGNYLTVVFRNINNSLIENKNITLDKFKFFKESDEDRSLIDEDRNIVYEGFGDTYQSKEFTVETSGRSVENITTDYTTAKLYLDDNKYLENDTMKITLFDEDLNTDISTRQTANVKVTRGSETKDVTLLETGYDTGRFEGYVDIWLPDKTDGNIENEIEVEYIDKQPSTGNSEKSLVKKAEIKSSVEFRRRAQLYIEKDLYEKDEEIRIILEDFGANEKSDEIEEVKVEIGVDDYLTLRETGKNTGIFEFKGKIQDLKPNFTLKYTYEIGDRSKGGDNLAKIHVPIKNLEDGIIYKVQIPAGVVGLELLNGYAEIENEDRSNDKYEWSFKTNTSSSVDSTFTGSVVEDYDNKFKITLVGQNFNENTEVYFRGMSGEEHKGVIKTSESTDKVLQVYLPLGRDRLKVGLYDVLVGNKKTDKQAIEYGVFSVVKKGEYVSNEDYEQEDSSTIGSSKKYTKTSLDTLELKSGYSDYNKLELDLDEIMGGDTWSRNIVYRGNSRDTINTLITKSKWADITLYDVSLDRNTNNNNIVIRTGRTSNTISDNIKKKIRGNSIKSDFVEVGGSNYRSEKLKISIPFRQSNGRNLKLLKYDEYTRRITEIKLTDKNINKTDKRIEVELTNALPSDNVTRGIFVVVE